VADNRAEAEIFGKVIKSRWPLHPEAISDDDYDKMLAENADSVKGTNHELPSSPCKQTLA